MKLIPDRDQPKRELQRAGILRKMRLVRELGYKTLFLDEVNFTKLSMMKQEWSNKGTNISVDQKQVYTGYVSVCATICEDTGIEALVFQNRAYDRYDFIQYLYWLSYINNGQPLAIFMDNLSAHKTAETKLAYQQLVILPIFNLAYSPDYNPIELVFA